MKATRQTVLTNLIRRHQWYRGAELGLWQGATFGYLLDTFPALYLVGVDNWWPGGVYFGKDMHHAESMVRAHQGRHSQRCEVHKCDTVVAAEKFAPGFFNFVFIDASHDTASVVADIRAWRPKLRSDGWLTGHDANLETVRAALDAELPGWQPLEANCWAYPPAARP